MPKAPQPKTVRLDSLPDGVLCTTLDARFWDDRRGVYETIRGMRMRKVKHNECRARVFVIRDREYLDIAPGTQVVLLTEDSE